MINIKNKKAQTEGLQDYESREYILTDHEIEIVKLLRKLNGLWRKKSHNLILFAGSGFDVRYVDTKLKLKTPYHNIYGYHSVIENYPDVFKVISNYSLKGNSEYFLIANRQALGFDSDMFGSGLVVYHVDETVSGLVAGNPNDNEQHKYVDLEEADGEDDLDHRNKGDSEDFFAGSTSYSSFTNPLSNTYPTDFSDSSDDGRRTAISVTNISASASTMTADITVTASDTSVPTTTKKNIFTPNYDGYNDKAVFSEATGTGYTIYIYDMAGRQVRSLSGTNEWDGLDSSGGSLPGGVYIYQIRQENGSITSGAVILAK